MNTSRRILTLLAPYRRAVVFAFVLTAFACALSLMIPVLIQRLLDNAASGGRVWPALATSLLAVFALQALFSVAIAKAIGPVGLAVVRDLRHALYARLQRLSLTYHDTTPAGILISRIMDDVAVVQSLIATQAIAILTDLGMTIGVFVLLLVYDLGAGLMALLVLCVYAVAFPYFSHRIRTGSRDIREQLDGIFGRLKERLDGVLVVRAYAQEQAEIADFRARIDAAHGPRLRLGRLVAAFSNLSLALNGLGTTLVFAVAAVAALQGRLSPGEVVATATLAGYLFGPVTRLSDLANTFEQAATSVDRVYEILDLTPEVCEPSTPGAIGRASGLVEFVGVSFGYTARRLALADIHLRVEPGKKVAIVGPTGSGKTTLLNLLLRFHDPTVGAIHLDGIALDQLSLADLRRQVVAVPQEPTIFARSVAENIRYGSANVEFSRIEAAAKAAHVHEFAMSLPHAYDTRVGEGGHKLSQGERQRLSIARAFCKDAPVIVLDEATSSLDTACEGKIQTALANLLEGRTAFVIAHRLATVIDADLIVVMDSGRIVESGTHRELISDRHGTYSRLAASQLLGAETGDRLRDQGAVEPTRLGLWARTARSADAGLSQAETRSA